MRHHAYVIESDADMGVARALAWIETELGQRAHLARDGRESGNPDVLVLRYGLFSVDEVRRLLELAAQTPMSGTTRAIVVAASRIYHEAQNALLKLFEEPPVGTYLFLVVPSLGQLLPTLRSRVLVLARLSHADAVVPEIAESFVRATSEGRSKLIKKLSTGKDDEERRAHRDLALELLGGIERLALVRGVERERELLSELQTLRDYLYDRSAPVKQILEHLAIVTPRSLVQ